MGDRAAAIVSSWLGCLKPNFFLLGGWGDLHRTPSVDGREIGAMSKTMEQMNAIATAYMRECVRVQMAAYTIVAAHHATIVAARHAAVQSQQDQVVLQARHDQMLLQAMVAHANGHPHSHTNV